MLVKLLKLKMYLNAQFLVHHWNTFHLNVWKIFGRMSKSLALKIDKLHSRYYTYYILRAEDFFL